MFVEQMMTGGDRNYGYLVADESTQSAMIIDPSYAPEKLVALARKKNFNLRYIFNSHDHYDHTNGNEAISELTGLPVLKYGDTHRETGRKILDGTTLPLGDLIIQILHTPGHTPDSICLYAGDAVFTGDTLFVGKVGGTDLGEQARTEYDSLHRKLMTLPDDTRVFPGHNYGVAAQSTIGHERKSNPFLIQPDLDAFIDLKKNWLEYKQKHGIK